MLRFLYSGEFRGRRLSKIIGYFFYNNIISITDKIGAVYMELLRIFNVKIVNIVFEIGNVINNSIISIKISKSINIVNLLKNGTAFSCERPNVCSIPALGVICENVFSFIGAKLFLNKLSAGSMRHVQSPCGYYLVRLTRG